jgi:hypothetical protein
MEINSHGPPSNKDIPGAIPSLRRVSCSSVSSTRSSMSQDSILSPTFSSVPNSNFYLDRVTSLLGRATSLPMDRAGQPLPSIPAHAPTGGSPPRSLPLVGSAPVEGLGASNSRASALIRSLSKGMDSFR